MATGAKRWVQELRCRHERESLFAFRDVNAKTKKAFPVFGTGSGNTRNHSLSLGREREIQETIPVVWDGNGKHKKPFP